MSNAAATMLASNARCASITRTHLPARLNPTYEAYVPRAPLNMHAALGAPLFVGSVLANFYFFMGSDVGHYFVYRAFTSWPIETPLVILFAYFGAQFSIEVKNWELRNEINQEKEKYE